MRYQTIDTISFTDIYGDSFAIKDMREIPDTYATKDTETIKENDRIDEIVSRTEYYGADTEGESYKLVDYNLEKLYEEKFDLSKITILKVPLR